MTTRTTRTTHTTHTPRPTRSRTCSTPIGELEIEVTPVGLCAVRFRDDRGAGRGPDERVGDDLLDDLVERAERQLLEYFAGDRTRFDVPLDVQVGTPFQRAVWAALETIPFGSTWSYAQQAEAIGRPRAVRAVGAANGRNPVPIVVPCHRVVGADGSLTGYAGGVSRKRWLLDHERAIVGA